MAGIPFLAVGFLMKVVAVVWFICAVVLVLVVLIQKGRGGGLSSAFGGMAGGVLGTKTGDFLTWVTVGLVCVFLSLSLVIAKYYKPTVTSAGPEVNQRQQQPVTQSQAPVPPPATEAAGGINSDSN